MGENKSPLPINPSTPEIDKLELYSMHVVPWKLFHISFHLYNSKTVVSQTSFRQF